MVTYVPPCKELLIYVLALPLQPQPEHITEEGKRSARAILTEREGRVGPSVTTPSSTAGKYSVRTIPAARVLSKNVVPCTRDFPQGQVTGERAGRHRPSYMYSRRTISVRSDSYPYPRLSAARGSRWWCSIPRVTGPDRYF